MSKAKLFHIQTRLDEDAFDAAFHDHYARVYEIMFRLTGDPLEADDLAAETFLKLWNNPPGRYENLGGWLYRVALRLGYNRLRGAQRRRQYESLAGREDLNSLSFPNPAHQAELDSEREQVRDTLKRMPERDVQVILLRHSGLTYKEIAAALSIAPNSVGTLLARAEERFEMLHHKGDYNASKK